MASELTKGTRVLITNADRTFYDVGIIAILTGDCIWGLYRMKGIDKRYDFYQWLHPTQFEEVK